VNSKIFTIGDIHGCYHTLQRLFDKTSPSKSDLLIFLGDYIDRGPRVKETLDFFIELEDYGFQVIFLLGNHESMLLDAYRDPVKEITWKYNGAETTLHSLGISQISLLDKKYLQFFQKMKLYVRVGNYLFVHAGFHDDENQPLNDSQMNLWSRNERYNSRFFKTKTIIHGHTPTSIYELKQRIKNQHHVINIDTGCVYNNRSEFGFLTALELPSYKIYNEINCD
jgi:serine/threonine protein phosphatase 1